MQGPVRGVAGNERLTALASVVLLSLILVIPATVGGINWYRARRARALFGP